MNERKVEFGQFFTKNKVWIKPQIIDFINNTNKKSILDPFAGNGDLLNLKNEFNISDIKGFDIDKSLNWKFNDSLKNIPKTDRLIITNPPYLAKNSAKRRNLGSYSYFKDNSYIDLYQLAIEKCLENHDEIIAIVPESFISTNLFKERLYSVTILEDNPFEDTECPICIACFSKEEVKETLIYKNDIYLDTFENLTKKKLISNIKKEVIFNDKYGNIGLRGLDGKGRYDKIKFCLPNELNYNLDNIKSSCRHVTVLNLKGYSNEEINKIIKISNKILNEYRVDTFDIFLAPFRGNSNDGKRRRRLDFKTAKIILEKSIELNNFD